MCYVDAMIKDSDVRIVLTSLYHESSGWTTGKQSNLMWMLQPEVAAIPSLVYVVDAQLPGKKLNSAKDHYPEVYQRHIKIPNASRVDFVPLLNGFGAQECNGYLTYIVSNYHHLPELTIFLHGKPLDHNTKMFEYIKLVMKDWKVEDIGFLHLNEFQKPCHVIDFWGKEFWDLTGFLPESKPGCATTMCCSQFIVSRARIHLRPRWFYENFLELIYESKNCAYPEHVWHMIFGEGAHLKDNNKVVHYQISEDGKSIEAPTKSKNANTIDAPFLTIPLGKIQKEMLSNGHKFADRLSPDKIKSLIENDFGNSSFARRKH